MRHLYTGTTEYLTVTVRATVSLDAQVVEFSFDRSTWITAAWTGTAGKSRQARALIDENNLPAAGTHTLWVKVTDIPEIPVINAGQVTVS